MFVHTRCRLITKKNTLAAFNSTGEEENGIKKRENSYPSSSRPNLLGHVGLYQTQPELLTTPSLIYYYNLLLFLSLSFWLRTAVACRPVYPLRRADSCIFFCRRKPVGGWERETPLTYTRLIGGEKTGRFFFFFFSFLLCFLGFFSAERKNFAFTSIVLLL